MAERKLSQYPNASSIMSTLKLVALQGNTPANFNIPKALLDSYITGLVGAGAPTVTWAARPMSGNTNNDRIIISDVGDTPQEWVWNAARSKWLPRSGVLRLRMPNALVAPANASLNDLWSAQMPLGLLGAGSQVTAEVYLTAATSDGAASTSPFSLEVFMEQASQYSVIIGHSELMNDRWLAHRARLVFLNDTTTVCYPWGNGYGTSSAFQTSTFDASVAAITLKTRVQKTTASDVVTLLGGNVLIEP